MSDLISRQHAIDEIRFYITEPDISDDETKIEGYNDGLEMAISILSILSSAEPERRWIPVTEALPNNKEYDWVLGQIRETDSGYLWIPRQVEYREIKDDWYEDSIGWLKENPDHAFEVIAWMPLPEPWRNE